MGSVRLAKAPTTAEAYQHSLDNHVLSSPLGAMVPSDITQGHVQDFLDDLANRTSVGVANQARSAISNVLGAIANKGLILANPTKGTLISKALKRDERLKRELSGFAKKRTLSEIEQAELLEAHRGTVVFPLLLLGLRFGLRAGEAIGLPWQNVDLEARKIDINQQLQYTVEQGVQTVPPKHGSNRILIIPTSLVAEFKHLKENAVSEMVCVDGHGHNWHPKHVSRDVRKAMIAYYGKDQKLPTQHRFRASYLTLLANKGMKPHDLKQVAGHKSMEETFRYYISSSTEIVDDFLNRIF
jgi:integrase